jgi:pimeloyl-ACP methyl ester carboxylesterase
MRTLARTIALVTLLSSAGSLLAQQPAAASGRTYRVNGADLYVETRGSGPPLVLLHGFTSCGASWGPHLERFAAQYRLHVVDLRGHGRSTNPGGAFTHRQSGRDIVALMDSLGLQRTSAMGISSGGMTLLHAATTQPERFESLVLIGATSYFPEQARKILRGATFEAIPREVRAEMVKCHPRGEPQLNELMGLFHGFKDSHDDMAFTRPSLARITARTLIVHGDRDEFFPVEIPVEQYRSIPKAYLYIVPNGDHVPIYGPLTQPFQEAALAFLGGKWERR